MSLKSQIESLLFIAAKPMSHKQIAELTGADAEAIKTAGDELAAGYHGAGGGIEIIRDGLKLQMVSAPENAVIIQKFLQDETSGDLSRPSLEALTIIAYRGPITKLDLDRIRGVNCALILRNLLLRGLIEAKHDKEKKETAYSVSFDFIRFLGVNDLGELPDFERLHQDDTIDRYLNAPDEAAEPTPEPEDGENV